MQNWIEKIQRGDITAASKRAGVSPRWYRESLEIPEEEWEPRHLKINVAMKEIVFEREAARASFIAEREARQKQENNAH